MGEETLGEEARRHASASRRLVRRQFLLLFTPLAILVAAVAIFVARVQIEADFSRMADNDRTRVKLAATEISAEIRGLFLHIRSLPNEDRVRAGLNRPSPDTLAGMASDFVTLLQRNPSYDQARWIDETGMEQVRVDKGANGGRPHRISQDKLQNKGDQPYFQEANRLARNELFVSSLDLNVENGRIEIPYKPTLRVAMPLSDDAGQRRGIVIINMLMAPSLENFLQKTNGEVMLIDRAGHILYGPDAKDHWAFRLDAPLDLPLGYPDAWKKITQADHGQFLDANGHWSWDLAAPKNWGMTGLDLTPEPHWIMLRHRPVAELRAQEFSVWRPVVEISVPLTLLLAGLCAIIALRSQQQRDAQALRARAEIRAAEQGRQLAAMERIQRRLATLAAIVNSSDDAIISKSLDSVITSWNPGATKLFGFSEEEAIGHPMTMLFPPGAEHEETEIITRIRRGETVTHFESRRRHKNGHLIDVSISISPIFDDEGRIIGASKVARDISQRKREQAELERYRDHLEDLVAERTAQIAEANQRLQDHEKFLTTITDNLPGMVGYWDRRLHCRFANRSYLDWFGRTPEEMVDQDIETILGPALFEANRPMIEAALAGQPQHFEREIRKADATIGYTLVHYIPDHKNDEIVGFFVLVTDITAVKQAEIRLREVNRRLEAALDETKAASNAKGQFLANMSHEIRTPMNAVLGFLGLVLEGELPDTVRRQLTTAHNSAKSLLLLINDILDLSKLQSGRIDLEHIGFNLERLLRTSLEMLQIRAREKKLQMQLIYPADMPQSFIGDPMRIRQIITNLVGNAIKFTDVGGITITASQDEKTGGVIISVRDTGIGMTREQAQRIFNPFVQGDSSTTRRFGGTGLGVSICKQLAENMGGRIWVDSESGIGSTFHVLMRLAPLDSEQTPAIEDQAGEEFTIASRPQSWRRLRVLLVDDIAENIELAEARLTARGHDVTSVRNGQDAVAAAEAHPFDLILMDVHMPGLNGLDATREIRRRQIKADYQVVIVALTASVFQTEQQQCFDAGMNAFIGKPIDFGELFQLMESLVPSERGERFEAEEPPPPTHAASHIPPLPGIDMAAGLRRWNDPARFIAALTGFATKYDQISDELRRAHHRQDWNAARESAHALKGVAGNLALSDMAGIAESLNDAFKAQTPSGIEDMLNALDAAWMTAQDSIGQLAARDLPPHTAREEASSPESAAPASLNDLRSALETDDPDIANDALARLEPPLSMDDQSHLQRLIDEFEFDAARRLLSSLTEAAAG